MSAETDITLVFDELSVRIAAAVSEAAWEQVVLLLIERRQALERAFNNLPDAPAARQALREIAENVLNADGELLAVAEQARRATADDLKRLNSGRQAAHAYQANQG